MGEEIVSDKKENILAIPVTSLFRPKDYLRQGYTHDPYGAALLNENIENGIIPSYSLERWDIEFDPSWQQPIPHIIVHDGPNILIHARRNPADKRLLNKYALGYGGHIEPDQDSYSVRGGGIRELLEELEFFKDKVPFDDTFYHGGDSVLSRLRSIGTVKDWTNDVGRVHLGIVYTFDASGLTVLSKEEHETKWVQDFSLLDGVEFESWGEMILHNLHENNLMELFR